MLTSLGGTPINDLEGYHFLIFSQQILHETLSSNGEKKLDLYPKCLQQSLHWNGFFPVWTVWCDLRFSGLVNLLGQNSHWNGFSPVWTLWCDCRCEFWLNLFEQNSHWNGFSPVCILR